MRIGVRVLKYAGTLSDSEADFLRRVTDEYDREDAAAECTDAGREA